MKYKACMMLRLWEKKQYEEENSACSDEGPGWSDEEDCSELSGNEESSAWRCM
jgi:hypothetical protein